MEETIERIQETVNKLEHLAVILLDYSATSYKEIKGAEVFEKVVELLPEIFKDKLNERARERRPDAAEEICKFNEGYCETLTKFIWDNLLDKVKELSEENDEKFRDLKLKTYALRVVEEYLEQYAPSIIRILKDIEA